MLSFFLLIFGVTVTAVLRLFLTVFAFCRHQRPYGVRASREQRGRVRPVLRDRRHNNAGGRDRRTDPGRDHGRNRRLQWARKLYTQLYNNNNGDQHTRVCTRSADKPARTDRFAIFRFSADNRSKQRRQQRSYRAQDFTAFAERNENQRIHISPQLTLATFQFLSSSTRSRTPAAGSRRRGGDDMVTHPQGKM